MIIVGLVILAGVVGFPADVQKSYDSTAQKIRGLGWHCPEVRDVSQESVDQHGVRYYRVRCGFRGPDYLTAIHPNGGQSTRPIAPK